MTFFDAAVQILKDSNRPLHYKKITELAISKSMLSHVGKTPDVLMEAKLSEEASKTTAPVVVKIRPGVFALAASARSKPILKSNPSVTLGEPEKPEEKRARSSSTEATAEPGESQPSQVANDVDSGGRGRQKRRRRRSRGGKSSDGGSQRRGATAESARTQETAPSPEPETEPAREPAESLAPEQPEDRISRAAIDTLQRLKRPISGEKLAQRLSRSLGSKVSPPLVEQALEDLNLRRIESGRRPPFLRRVDGWSLTDKELGADMVKGHDALQASYDHIAADTASALATTIAGFDHDAAEALVRATLVGLGFETVLIERPERCTVFKASAARSLVALDVAVLVRTERAPASADEVAAFRGRLARYNVHQGVMVSLKSGFDEDAAREAADSDLAPISLFDARSFAPVAIGVGIGVRHYSVRVPILDRDFTPTVSARN